MDITSCNQDFGSFIRTARERQGRYQEDVAREAGISQVYYSHIERGARNVDLSLALLLCKILFVDINVFIQTQTKKMEESRL